MTLVCCLRDTCWSFIVFKKIHRLGASGSLRLLPLWQRNHRIQVRFW